MPQPYFVKGLIGKVLAYGGLQIRTSLPHGLQPTNERRAESKLAYAMPSKEEEDKVKSLRTRMLFLFINSILTSNFLLYIYKLPTFVTYLTYY